MITEDFFTRKLTELKQLRLLNLTEGIRDAMYSRLKFCNPADFQAAVEDLLYEQEKFTFVRLKLAINKHQNLRLEKENSEEKERERKSAVRFFKADYPESCRWGECQTCLSMERCTRRGNEWIKSIKAILNGPRSQAKAKSEEVIGYMKTQFLGGIVGREVKTKCNRSEPSFCPSFSWQKMDWAEFTMRLTEEPNKCPECGQVLY